MQAYLNKGKELLKLLLNNGYEAYFVGEIVRNIIIGVKYKRADIITNADFETLRQIYKAPNVNVFDGDIELVDENTLKIKYLEYDFYFHQFSNNNDSLISENRIAFTKHYSKNLSDDLATKNFTINAIAMSYGGKLTDADEGCEDIKNRKIRTVGSPKQKFINSPIEILNALVLASELKFKISDKTYSWMKKKAKLLSREVIYDMSECLIDILENDYAKYAIRLLVKAKINRYIPSLSKGLYKLACKFKKISFEELLLMSFVLNKEIDERYLPFAHSPEMFTKIYNLAVTNPKAKYDDLTLFKNGLDVCLEANFINYMLGKSRLKTKAIKKNFELLSIKKRSDLKYNKDDIIRITDSIDVNVVNDIMDKVSISVLKGEIANDYKEIQSAVLKALTERGILYDLDRKKLINSIPEVSGEETLKSSFEAAYNNSFNGGFEKLNDDEKNISDQINQSIEENDFTNHRLRMLEERLDQQDRMLREKNERLRELEYQKVLETTSKVVNNALDLVRKDSQINSMISNEKDFELALRGFIVEYLERDKNDEEN